MQLPPELADWLGLASGALVLLGGLILFFYPRRRTQPAPSRKQARSIDPEALGKFRGRLEQLVRPTWRLAPARQPGFSKLGGHPELPAGLAWPTGEAGPRAFLAQIDLATLRAEGGPEWAPADGRIYAFYDSDRHGCADVVQVVYATEPPAGARAAITRSYRERRISFEELTSAPSLDWLGPDAAGFDYETFQSAAGDLANAPPDDEIQHRIDGYPSEIQDECMRLSCEHLARGLAAPVHGVEPSDAIQRASREWRMLLQVDSDPDLGMNFGDGGRLYVFIREQHARRGDFSKTVALWQTY